MSEIANGEIRSGPIFTPTERAYLLRLLGGPLEVAGMTAQDVLVLRGKVEGL